MASPFNLRIEGREEGPVKTALQESEELAGETVHLIISLPDGNNIEDDVKVGVNVEWVIYRVANQTGMSFEQIVSGI